MKKWFNKTDPLVLFFLLSLVTLYSFVGDINYFLPKPKTSTLKTYIDSKFVFGYPKQGLIKNNEGIELYNPSYKLLYSIDGGKNYHEYHNELVLELNSKNLKNKITSIRSKKTFGVMPELCSFLIKAEHVDGKQFTKPLQLTYYSNYNSKLPIVNLVINEDDLFHYNKGVMNLGEQSWYDKGFYKKPWERNANYSKRGVKSKKQTFFQYFKENSLVFKNQCLIQISGNATRSFPQKSFKLKSINNEKFKYQFFSKKGLIKYKSLAIRQSGNDNYKTLFADLLMQNLAIELSVLTQNGLPTNIFINGNYWGIYNMRERYDTYFIGKFENVKSKQVTILEGQNGELKKGKEKVRLDFIEMIDTLTKCSKVSDEMVDYIETKINIESFTNYILLETFYGNGDWLNNNVMWYKAGNKKWKWLLNDLDYALAYTGSGNINKNYFVTLKQSSSITAKLSTFLLSNERYKNYLKNKAKLLIANTMEVNRINSIFLNLKQLIEPNIDYQINRWKGVFTKLEWEQNCENNLKFLLNRRQIFLSQIDEL